MLDTVSYTLQKDSVKQLMDQQMKAELSPFSRQILVRVTNGQKIKTIASELGTTRDVVDGEMRRIYQHFHVKGVALLVQAAILDGWIEHPAERSWGDSFERAVDR